MHFKVVQARYLAGSSALSVQCPLLFKDQQLHLRKVHLFAALVLRQGFHPLTGPVVLQLACFRASCSLDRRQDGVHIQRLNCRCSVGHLCQPSFWNRQPPSRATRQSTGISGRDEQVPGPKVTLGAGSPPVHLGLTLVTPVSGCAQIVRGPPGNWLQRAS